VDLKCGKWRETGEECTMRNFNACTLHKKVTRVVISRRMRWAMHVARTVY
jgi:hypothetical protein